MEDFEKKNFDLGPFFFQPFFNLQKQRYTTYPQPFKGFASPFYPSKMHLAYMEPPYMESLLGSTPWVELTPENCLFEFWMLPLRVANEHWQSIRHYFETQQSVSSHTLFAVQEKKVDIVREVKNSQDLTILKPTPWSPAREHVQFLEYFRKQAFPQNTLPLTEQYKELWLNVENQYIPAEIETLYFFAYHTCLSFKCGLPPPATTSPRINRALTENGLVIKEISHHYSRGRAHDCYLSEKPYFSYLWVDDYGNINNMNENQTQCAIDDSFHPSLKFWNIELHRQWLRIFSDRALQVSSVIQWMESNFPLLAESEIQENIQVALFMPGLLKDKIQEEPSILVQLRELIGEAMTYYSNPSPANLTTLFLIRLGICLESFAPRPSMEILEVYETRLLEYAKLTPSSAPYMHLLLLYQVALPQGEHSLRQLIKAHVWLNYHEKINAGEMYQLPDWLLIEVQSPLERYHTALSECFTSQGWCEQTFSEVFTLILGGDELPSEPCEEAYPMIVKGKYFVDVEEGEILRDSGCAEESGSVLEPLIYLQKAQQKHFPSLKHKTGLFWGTGKQFICESGLYLIESQEKGHQMGKKIPFLHDRHLHDKWFYQVGVEPNFFSGSVLADKYFFDYWAYSDSTEWSHLVICKKGESQPLYLVKNRETHFEIFKILSNGKEGPTLVNIWEEKQSLGAWFTRLGDKNEVCVWMNKERGVVEEIEFLHLNLTFKQEEGRFYCQNYPGFVLAGDQSIEELGFFEGALVLEDEKEKIVLVPARHLNRNDANFSTRVTLRGRGLSKNERFFFYQLDAIAGVLVNPSAEGNLFLAFLFALQRNYTQALFYLARAHAYTPYRKECDWAMRAFTSLKDRSPEALAFHMRFGLHMIHHTQQMLIGGYREKKYIRGDLTLDFFTKLAKKFTKYLGVHSIKGISRVPEESRLSQEEELFLLQTLQAVIKEEEAKKTKIGKVVSHLTSSLWQEVLNIRLALLQHKKWSKAILPHPHPLLFTKVVNLAEFHLKEILQSFPPVYLKPSDPLLDFVRLKDEDVLKYFIPLYERASRGEATLDLFYLTRNTYPFGYAEAYSLVLQYVQRHPEEFKGLQFGDDPEVNKEVARKIFESVEGIYKRLRETASDIGKFLLNDVVFFRYQKLITLTAPSPAILAHPEWALPRGEIENLQDLRGSLSLYFQETYFTASQEPIVGEQTPFAFAEMQKRMTKNSSLYYELQHLHAGYKQLQHPQNGKTVFRLKNEKTLKECLLEAKQWLVAKRAESLRIRDLAESMANNYPKNLYPFGLRKMSRNLPWITLEGILTQAYLNKNARMIKEANPSLTPSQIQELIYLTVQYHILRPQIYQLERGIEALERGSIEGFAQALACYGSFNPVETPEIFLYQSRTGKTLRKGQAELFEWELTTAGEKPSKVRLFAAPAGDGKTTLYIPIAMKRFQRMGYTPISISSKPLYLVDREGLKETAQHTLSFGIDVVELALNTATVASDFEWIYQQLSLHGAKRGFKLTPEVYYALHLKYQLALDCAHSKTVYWISEIFSFLANKGAALGDECRLNCSPFTQAKMGIGKPISLPENDRKVFLEIYRALVSENILLPNQKSVKEAVGLDKNQQATLNDVELGQIKEVLCTTLSQHRLFDIPSDQRFALVQYWLGKAEESDWLKNRAGPGQARAIDLVKIYFEEFFNKAMKLIGKMQHVRSIRPGEEIHVPARARQATCAYFEEVYITLLATIHGLLQEGLDKAQVQKLIAALEQKVIEEVGSSGKISETEKMVARWVGRKQLTLNSVSTKHLLQDSDFYARVHKNTEAIFWYLEHIVLPSIQYSPEQFSVTPIYFLNAFNHITLFSADPGPKEIYGIFTSDQNVRTHPLFVAHALHQFLAPTNRQYFTFPFLNQPLDLFHALLSQDPTLFSHLRMLCDGGGTLRNFTAGEIVSDFFKFLNMHPQIDFDGVIIFEEASNKEAETELLLWLKAWKEPKVIKGHDVPQAVKALGLKWEKLKLLTVIDPSHRAGANIEQPPGSSVLVLLGEELTLSDTVQTALRGRGVLTGNQRLIWGAERKLLQSIAKEISPEKVLEWTACNGVKTADQEVLLSAYQQIDYHVAFPVWNALNKEKGNPEAQIALWKKYRKGFVKRTENDLVKRFKGKRAVVSSEKLLWAYAEEKYNSFGFEIPWKKATALHKKLTPIIAAVAQRQPQLLSSSTLDATRQTYVHIQQKEEMRKEFISDTHTDLQPESRLSLPSELNINRGDFVSTLCEYSQQASQVFHSPGLTNGLWFTNNALHTAKSGGVSLKEGFLKPVQYILVVKHQLRWAAFALSDGEASLFQKQMNEMRDDGLLQCALLSAKGRLVQNGKRGAAFSQKELQTDFIQDVVIDVGLTRCASMNAHRFLERIKTWTDFWPMWTKMKQCQPLPSYMHTQQVERLVPEHIKNYIKPQPTFMLNSFLSSLFSWID